MRHDEVKRKKTRGYFYFGRSNGHYNIVYCFRDRSSRGKVFCSDSFCFLNSIILYSDMLERLRIYPKITKARAKELLGEEKFSFLLSTM